MGNTESVYLVRPLRRAVTAAAQTLVNSLRRYYPYQVKGFRPQAISASYSTPVTFDYNTIQGFVKVF